MAGKPAVVYCVILNWNNASDTIASLRSVKRVNVPAGNKLRILCVDNHSTDGSFRAIKAAVKGVDFLRTGGNLGYAGGNNAGIRYALNHGAQYVWILNNDIEADKNSLAGLIDAFKNGKNLGASGSLILYHGSRNIWFAGGIYNKFTGRTSHYLENAEYKKSMDAPIRAKTHDFLSGCSMMLSREALEKTGMMDERLYLLFEEMDIFSRMKKAGYKWEMSPSSVIYHKVSSTLKESGLRTYYFTRNMLQISKTYFPFFFPFVLLYSIRYPLLSAAFKQRKNLKYILRAYWDAFRSKGGPYEG